MTFEEAIKNVCNPNIGWDLDACEIVCREAGLLEEWQNATDDFENVVFEAIEKLGYTYGENYTTTNTKITYRWNDNNETDYIITDGIYDFGDWLNGNGVQYEQEGDTYHVIDECGNRTGETYTVLNAEPTEEELIG